MKDLTKFFSLDLRSLALFRIILGIIFICDILVRLRYLDFFYSENGVYPLELSFVNELYSWSLFYLSTNKYYTLALFILALISGSLFTLGIFPRFNALICWIFTVSIHQRAWNLLCGGDIILKILFMVAIFLPTNHYLSLRPKPAKNNLFFSPINFYIFFQVVYIYLVAQESKDFNAWFIEGSALRDVLLFEALAGPLTHLILPFTTLLKGISRIVYLVEWTAPLLIIIPYKSPKLRLISIYTMITFHFCIFFFMVLGLFPWICICYWILFLPKEFWEYNFVKRIFNFNDTKTSNNNRKNKLPFYLTCLLTVTISLLSFRPNVLDSRKKELIVTISNNLHNPFFNSISRLLDITNNWPLFSGVPQQFNYWHSIIAKYSDGNFKELLSDTKYEGKKPKNLYDLYPTFRHWYHYNNISGYDPLDQKFQEILLLHLCRETAKKKPEATHIAFVLRGVFFDNNERNIYEQPYAEVNCEMIRKSNYKSVQEPVQNPP